MTDAAAATADAEGTIASIDDSTVTVNGAAVKYSAIYEISNNAAGATAVAAVTDLTALVGKTAKVYGDTVYLTFIAEPYTAPVSGTPGERTLKNYLQTAMNPVGTALYVYGGSWDWQDVNSSNQALTIGLPQSWIDFFQQQDANGVRWSYANGELLHRRFGKPKKRGTPAHVLWGKRVVVFVLWTISMVFFRVGSGNLSGMAENLGVGDAFVYLGRCLMNSWSPARFAGELYCTAYTGVYANTIMVAAYWAFAALALAFGIWLDHRRNFACKNKPAEVALASAKHRNALYVVLIVFILVGYIMQSGGFNANAFGPYAGF